MLLKYIPKNLSDTDLKFVTTRVESMEVLRDSRGLTSVDAWERLQEEFRDNKDDETIKEDMYLIALPLAFSEAGYIYSTGRYPEKSYLDCLTRCLFALQHGVETYDPTKSTFKHHIEQSLRVVMDDVPLESIEKENRNFDLDMLLSREELLEVFKNGRYLSSEEQIFNAITLKEAFASEEYQNNDYLLPYVLGRDDQNKLVVRGLDDCHALVAGGSDDTPWDLENFQFSFLNGIIMSLLYSVNINDLRLVLIDNDGVCPFSNAVYDGVDRLLFPVMCWPESVLGAIEFTLQDELKRRLNKFSEADVSSIAEYNEKCDSEQHMPHIVIVIANYYNIVSMNQHRMNKVIEGFLNKMVMSDINPGIHLIISSCNTFSLGVDAAGLIGTRIAFPVQYKTALWHLTRGRTGAESLRNPLELMYYENGSDKGKHLRGVMVADEEVERVTTFLKAFSGNERTHSEALARFTYLKNCARERRRCFSGPNGEISSEIIDRIMEIKHKRKGESSYNWSSILEREFSIGMETAEAIDKALVEMNIFNDNDEQ